MEHLCGLSGCTGDAYRYTLQPVFSSLGHQFRCHVRRRHPDVMYQLWFYVTVPGTEFETPRVRRQIVYRRVNSDTVAVLAVLPRYPRYYRRIGSKFYDITAVLGSKYAGVAWGWGPGLRYYRGYWVVFFCMDCELMHELGTVYLHDARGDGNADGVGMVVKWIGMGWGR